MRTTTRPLLARRLGAAGATSMLLTTVLTTSLLPASSASAAVTTSTAPAASAMTVRSVAVDVMAAEIPTPGVPWIPTWTSTLLPGTRSSAVKAAQKRMTALGYWSGLADGRYGPQTVQAVMALQKATGLRRTGVLNADVRAVLVAGTRPQARTTQGSTIEVDLRRQLLLVVVAGRTRWAFNTSTGSGRYYYQAGVRHLATTPRGHFALTRQIDGRRVAPLGVLYRPKYFYRGYAVHGSASIPAYPASHGCARLSGAAMDYLWSSGLTPLGRTVWIY